MHVCISVYVYTCVSACARVRERLRGCMWVCAGVCGCVYVCVFGCLCACVFVLFPNAWRRVLVFEGGVWGRDRVRSDFGNDIAHVRARSRTTAICPMRCAVPLGLAWIGAVYSGSVTPLCRGDWWWARRVRCAEPLGLACIGAVWPLRLAGRAWCGCRCAVVIGGESVVWVAQCRCDWRVGRRVGGAAPL